MKLKKVFAVVCILAMLLINLCSLPLPVGAAETGLTFSSGFESLLRTQKKLTSLPKTFEATITVPALGGDQYKGNILSCYTGEANSHWFFWDVREWETGSTRVRFLCGKIDTGDEVIANFENVLSGLEGTDVHLALVLDTDNSAVKLYVNGTEWTGTTTYTKEGSATASAAGLTALYASLDTSKFPDLALGGDLRPAMPSSEWAVHHVDNWRFFRGAIFDAAAFGDIRTPSEIASDKQGMPTDANLMFWYDTANLTNPEAVTDKSGNGYTLINGKAALKTNGLTFSSGFESLFSAEKSVQTLPKTLEATITVPALGGDQFKGNILACNDNENPSHWFIWDVREWEKDNTRLRFLCGKYDTGEEVIANFEKALNGLEGKTVHVALVLDTDNSTVKLYIDGAEWKGTVSYSKSGSATASAAGLTALYGSLNTSKLAKLTLGGDWRKADMTSEWQIHHLDNNRYFRGAIFDAAAFTDVRTQSEIASDMIGTSNNESNLLFSFNTAEINSAGAIPDKSGNGYDLSGKSDWFTTRSAIGDYAYSFAVIGDTQVVARDESVSEGNSSYSPDFKGNFAKIFDYLVDNKDEKNIQFAFHMGDITDWNNPAEWELAMENINKLNGKIPYNLVRGNHDGASDFIANYTTSTFKSNVARGEEYGFFDGRGIKGYTANTLNAYQTITVGDYKYLMLSLDLGPCDAVIEWANEVIESHPYHNVIISTHSYLHSSGAYMDDPLDCSATQYNPGGKYNGGSEGVYWDFRIDSHKNGGSKYAYQDASYMWNNLVKKHKNICMVLCGHECSDDILKVEGVGDHGNKIVQLLVDAQCVDRRLQQAGQGHAGIVAMLYFSEDGKTVSTEYYSTIREQYFKTENIYSFEIDLIEFQEDDDNNNNNNQGGNDQEDDNSQNNKPNKPNATEGTKQTEDATEPENNVATEAPVGENGEEKKGCGSSITASAVIAVTAIGLGITALKKKE